MDQSPNNLYNNYYAFYSNKSQKLKNKIQLLALGRLLSFIGAVLLTYYLVQIDVFLGVSAGIAALVVFVFFVINYFQFSQTHQVTKNLMHINRQEIGVLRGHYEHIESGDEFLLTDHNYVKDLELFGKKSLFQFINRTCTYTGKNELASWLSGILEDKSKIKNRQKAVRELNGMIDWRQKYLAIGQLLDINLYNDTHLISWAKEAGHGVRRLYYQITRWLLPVLTILGIISWINGTLPVSILLLLLAFNRFVIWQASRRAKSLYQKVTKQVATLKSYKRLFEHIEAQGFQSDELQGLKNELYARHKPASEVIKKLTKISDSLESGENMLVDLLVNTVFLWNVHHIIRLEKWHSKYSDYIEKWIGIIGKFDAFISLANFSYNNADYVFPEFNDQLILEAEQMGHPLINKESRVCNDFQIDEKGKVFIITGANMAGKSTFLRTIGVNMVLGMIGAPVCAKNMQFKITRLFTSMNITDSLLENESYFYAEVKRLKQLVDEAMHSSELLVLLDEILTGTNTRDKEKASKAFLERLLGMRVTSLIATHDLSLTTLAEKYPNKIFNKSFEVDMVNQ